MNDNQVQSTDMQGEEKRDGFFKRWQPTIVVATLLLIVMGCNRLFWQSVSVDTIAMVVGLLLGILYAYWWSNRRDHRRSYAFYNAIAICLVVLLLSFLFMALPSILDGTAERSALDGFNEWLTT